MVRRLSLASLDSGAESPVYGAEPFRRQVRTGCAATRRNLRHVGHRPAQRKMVCKGHPCIYAADGIPNDQVRVIVGRASRFAVPRQAH